MKRPPIKTWLDLEMKSLMVEKGRWQGRFDVLIRLESPPLEEILRLPDFLIRDGVIWPQIRSISTGQRSRGAHRHAGAWQLGPVLMAALMKRLYQERKIVNTRAVPKPRPAACMYSARALLELGERRAEEVGLEVE